MLVFCCCFSTVFFSHWYIFENTALSAGQVDFLFPSHCSPFPAQTNTEDINTLTYTHAHSLSFTHPTSCVRKQTRQTSRLPWSKRKALWVIMGERRQSESKNLVKLHNNPNATQHMMFHVDIVSHGAPEISTNTYITVVDFSGICTFLEFFF